MEDIISHNGDSIVIVDEAYIDFGGKSALELIDKYDNLVVVRTFSKSRSMAGLRIGYAISNPILIKALNDVKYSYNSYTMNRPSIIMGTESVKDDAYFKAMVARLWLQGQDLLRVSDLLALHVLSHQQILCLPHMRTYRQKSYLRLRKSSYLCEIL